MCCVHFWILSIYILLVNPEGVTDMTDVTSQLLLRGWDPHDLTFHVGRECGFAELRGWLCRRIKLRWQRLAQNLTGWHQTLPGHYRGSEVPSYTELWDSVWTLHQEQIRILTTHLLYRKMSPSLTNPPPQLYRGKKRDCFTLNEKSVDCIRSLAKKSC